MAYGSGWEIDETSGAFWARVDEYAAEDSRLEEMIEGLSWALLADPLGLPNGRRLAGTLWYATLGIATAYLVFYEVDEAARKVIYTSISLAP